MDIIGGNMEYIEEEINFKIGFYPNIYISHLLNIFNFHKIILVFLVVCTDWMVHFFEGVSLDGHLTPLEAFWDIL